MARRAGRWPHLKLFEVYEIVGDLHHASKKLKEDFCRGLLHEAWPDLEMRICGEEDEDEDD